MRRYVVVELKEREPRKRRFWGESPERRKESFEGDATIGNGVVVIQSGSSRVVYNLTDVYKVTAVVVEAKPKVEVEEAPTEASVGSEEESSSEPGGGE